ncbi:MAG TPA: hypothetical protein VF625_07875 [Longimicrobium sp.]|jgi:hypothetical protein
MPLISCEDCGHSVSTRAVACPQCGCPGAGASLALAPFAAPLPPAAPDSNDVLPAAYASPPLPALAAEPGHPRVALSCPQCGSDNVRRLALIYREGLTQVSLATGGAGAGWGGAGGLAAGTSGRQQTMASVGAAPPVPTGMGLGLALGLLGVLLAVGAGTMGIVVGLVLLAVSGVAVYGAWNHNQAEYPRLLQAWEKTFMCQRCGERFVPDGATPLP